MPIYDLGNQSLPLFGQFCCTLASIHGDEICIRDDDDVAIDNCEQWKSGILSVMVAVFLLTITTQSLTRVTYVQQNFRTTINHVSCKQFAAHTISCDYIW